MTTIDPIGKDDFGFSSETFVTPNESRDLQKDLELLYSEIAKFLDNLSVDPEKTTITWPDRVEKIKAFKKKLAAIAGVKE